VNCLALDAEVVLNDGDGFIWVGHALHAHNADDDITCGTPLFKVDQLISKHVLTITLLGLVDLVQHVVDRWDARRGERHELLAQLVRVVEQLLLLRVHLLVHGREGLVGGSLVAIDGGVDGAHGLHVAKLVAVVGNLNQLLHDLWEHHGGVLEHAWVVHFRVGPVARIGKEIQQARCVGRLVVALLAAEVAVQQFLGTYVDPQLVLHEGELTCGLLGVKVEHARRGSIQTLRGILGRRRWGRGRVGRLCRTRLHLLNGRLEHLAKVG
jgi:hypothetical protein